MPIDIGMLELKCRTTANVLHSLGFASLILFCGLGLLSRGHHSIAFLWFPWITFGLFALGFSFRIVAYAAGIWKKIPKRLYRHLWKFGTGIFGIGSSVVIFLGATVARNSVVNELHMPPKDFPETIRVITLSSSFGIGFLVAAVFLLILTAIKLVEIGYLVVSSHGARLGGMISGFWGKDSVVLNRFGDEQNRKGFAVIGDLAGGFTLLFLCLLLGFGELTLQTKLVKWVAYYEDYLPAASYPGLGGADHDPYTRVVVDDNGAVSIAHIRGSQVAVDVIPPKH
jgi:hypothetical protein